MPSSEEYHRSFAVKIDGECVELLRVPRDPDQPIICLFRLTTGEAEKLGKGILAAVEVISAAENDYLKIDPGPFAELPERKRQRDIAHRKQYEFIATELRERSVGFGEQTRCP